MLRFLAQKIKNRKWLMLCLVMGNVLLISVLCCITMYSDGIKSRILGRRMNAQLSETGEYPLKLELRAVLAVVDKNLHTGDVFGKMDSYAEDFNKDAGSIKESVEYFAISTGASTVVTRNGKSLSADLSLGYMSNIADHITITSGTGFDVKTEDGVLPVIVSEKFLAVQKMVIGEDLLLDKIKDYEGNKLCVRIAGSFTCSDRADLYWVQSPAYYDSTLFLADRTFNDMFVDFENPTYGMRGLWYLLFDYDNLSQKRIVNIIDGTKRVVMEADQESSLTVKENYLSELEAFLTEDNKTAETLTILQAPILILLLAFIVMVSRQTIILERGEIAVLKSRGISKFQIICLYLIQSLLIGLISVIPGVLLGAFLCEALGSANAFMEFVGRTPLKIKVFDLRILLDCALGVLGAAAATVLPVVFLSDNTTVSQKQKRKKRRSSSSFWQRFGLDFVILAVGIYGQHTFAGHEEELAERVLNGESLDPLLYFSSALFILGAGLVATRVIHLIPKLIFLISGRVMSPALYASYTGVTRSASEQNYIMVFLILTISLGIYNADMARTINGNDENNVSYTAGADMIISEVWEENIISLENGSSVEKEYIEPDISRFENIKNVESAARVFKTSVRTRGSGYDFSLNLIAIDTEEFGKTANMPEGYLEEHFYNYLNDLSSVPNGVLLSTAFRDALGYNEGDSIIYSIDGVQVKGVVCGFVDYFPGERQYVTDRDWSGKEYVRPNVYMVANLAYVRTITGIRPYDVWIRVKDSTEPVYDYIEENNIKIKASKDATQTLAEHKNEALLQGTNGMLTVGFLIVLMITVIGFLIYWILSIKQRTLQFGVIRAMGLTMGGIFGMLINEQFFVTVLSIASGVFVGKYTSKLFIPLIQVAYTRADSILPLRIISEQSDTLRILTVAGVMVAACIVILGIFISRTGISQALKLGEDS
jgi:putative ABC transport system permease protein